LGSVYDYVKRFNHLSQYNSYHSDTEEKKMALFHQGLNPVLHEHFMLFQGYTLNELVSASIEQEMLVMLIWRRRGRRGLSLGLLGMLHPSTV
jgi:hypothetical protein